MPVLKRLNFPSRQKHALKFFLAVGGFACAVSIARLHSLVKITTSKDLTYDNANTATWSAGKLNIGLICACLPALRPAISRLLPGIFATTNQSSTEGHINTSSRRQGIGSGSLSGGRNWATGNLFNSREMESGGKEASDDELPLQSKCWVQCGTEGHEMVGYSSSGKNAQITVVTDVQLQVQNHPTNESSGLKLGGKRQVEN